MSELVMVHDEETAILGPNAQRFMDHLEIGLDAFDLNFADFAPWYATHETKGKGILFSQVKVKGRGKYKFKEGESKELFMLSITEKGMEWPYVKKASSFPFIEDQTPEACALLILSGMVRKLPVYPQIGCERCIGRNEQTDA